MDINNAELITFLEKCGLKASVPENSNQIFTKFSQNGSEYPMFLRQLTGGNLLQILTFIPCSVEKEAFFDLSRFLHMINKELDMPGFCCDEDSNTVFYRIVIPSINNNIDESLLHAYLTTMQNVCGLFGTIVQAIAIKAMTLEEMMAKANELRSQKK